MAIKVILVCSLLCLGLICPNAQNLTDLRDKKAQLELDIKKSAELLERYGQQRSKAITTIKLLNADLDKRLELITIYEKEINWLNDDITQLKGEIEGAEKDLQELKLNYARLIQKSYENRQVYNEFTFFLGAKSFNEAYRRFIILKDYNKYRRSQGTLIQIKTIDLERKKKLLETKLTVQTNALNQVIQEKDILQSKTVKLNRSIAQIKRKERQVRREIQENQDALKRLEKEIIKIIEAASAESYGATDFDKARGKLRWPVQSGVVISRFGEHQHPVLKYVKVNNNGVDIQAENDSGCFAVFEATVSRVVTIPGYNKTVILRHGKFLTVYANLATVRVKKGDKIASGQQLGRVYSGDGENSKVLHFEIWEENKKLNPENWLSD